MKWGCFVFVAFVSDNQVYSLLSWSSSCFSLTKPIVFTDCKTVIRASIRCWFSCFYESTVFRAWVMCTSLVNGLQCKSVTQVTARIMIGFAGSEVGFYFCGARKKLNEKKMGNNREETVFVNSWYIATNVIYSWWRILFLGMGVLEVKWNCSQNPPALYIVIVGLCWDIIGGVVVLWAIWGTVCSSCKRLVSLIRQFLLFSNWMHCKLAEHPPLNPYCCPII